MGIPAEMNKSIELWKLIEQMDDSTRRTFACDCAERILYLFGSQNKSYTIEARQVANGKKKYKLAHERKKAKRMIEKLITSATFSTPNIIICEVIQAVNKTNDAEAARATAYVAVESRAWLDVSKASKIDTKKRKNPGIIWDTSIFAEREWQLEHATRLIKIEA